MILPFLVVVIKSIKIKCILVEKCGTKQVMCPTVIEINGIAQVLIDTNSLSGIIYHVGVVI